jgi:hypothetical protein
MENTLGMLTSSPFRLAALVGVAASLVCACAHKPLNPQSLQEVRRLAIVVRVVEAAEVDVARVDSDEGRAYPELSPKEADAALAAQLAQQVGGFELEERIRAALVSRLPPTPPWSTAMPSIEVATSLDWLLVDDRSGPPDYRLLAKRGSNSVLEVVVESHGVRRAAGKTALFARGNARMFLLDGSTLWKAPFDIDQTADPEAEALDVVELRDGAYREALTDVVGNVTDLLAKELSAGRE